MSTRVIKVCGGDLELGNFVNGLEGPGSTGAIASRALLAEFDGVEGQRSEGNLRDWGRKFLPTNGGCAYIDLDHLELCLPEVRSATDYVASWHAMLQLAKDARATANRRLPEGQRIEVHANNSDGLSHSYGGHLNILISRATWRRLFDQQLHCMLQLASFLVSSMVYSGQGKVGSENDRPPVDFQLSQRADFLETVIGEQTTFRRPIVNTRDEPLTGTTTGAWREAVPELARLHVISLDTTLCHVGSLLKVGALQILLAILEAEEPIPQDLVLDDPVGAAVRWSHDPRLEHRERTVTDRHVTVVEHQRMFLDVAQRCARRVELDVYVAGATRILELWADTLDKLQARDYDTLSRRVDWVLKWLWLDRAMTRQPGLGWDAPRLKYLDHLYSSLDPEAGLYWAAERDGLVDRVVEPDRIERFTREPPEDTRAWTRSMLLRAAGPHVDYVSWDEIRLRDPRDPWSTSRVIRLPDPRWFTREWFEELLSQAGHADAAVDWMSESARPTFYH